MSILNSFNPEKIKTISQINEKGYFLAALEATKNPKKQQKIIIPDEPDYVFPTNLVKVLDMPTKELNEIYKNRFVYVLNLGIPIYDTILNKKEKQPFSKNDKVYYLINLQSILAIVLND